MKKTLLMAMAAIAMMTSCSKGTVNGGEPNPDPYQDGTAYLSLNLSGVSSVETKATGDPTLKSGEDNVNDITIMLFDNENKFLDIKTPSLDDFTKTDNSYVTKKAFWVPAKTAKVFIVVNNKNNEGTARFTMPTTNGDFEKDWSALNKTLSYTPTQLDNVNGFITQVTGKNSAGNDNYTMVNFGTREVDENGLIAVVTGKTPELAAQEVTSNVIYMDRMASKVEFKVSPTVRSIAVGPVFIFQGWELNATNRTMRLYSPHESDYSGSNPAGGMVAYRKDANYTRDTYGINGSLWTGYEEQFVFLRNIGTDGTGQTSTVSSGAGEIKYCPENTMAAADQLIGATTKVIIKGNFIPASSKTGQSFGSNASYFTYAGDYYTLAEIQAAYVTSAAAGHDKGLAQDMDKFMKAALFMTGAVDPANPTDAEYEDAVTALTNTSMDANKGIIARQSNAVRYFHQGVNYYSVLIRHDQRITGEMTLGKYGTVRNNWYVLTLNSVKKPGTPWIPGGPDDPITPPDTPDDIEAYLDVTMKINQWITWQQGIEL